MSNPISPTHKKNHGEFHGVRAHASQNEMLAAELRLWDRWSVEEAPNVFGFLELDEGGGFGEVGELYAPGRWVSAATLVIFVVYNIYSLVVLDVTFMVNPEEALKQLGGTDEQVLAPFYFSAGISDWVIRKATGNPDAHVSSVRVIGALELLGLLAIFFQSCQCLYRVKYSEGFVKWFAAQLFCWDLLPVLSSYSAMKLLNGVVPTVFASDLAEKMADFEEEKAAGRTCMKPLAQTLWWLLVVVIGFIIGFDTFLMKMRIVSIKAGVHTMSWGVVLPCLQFLVQVLGVVQLGPFVRKRLFTFIFGGEDGQLQEDEIERMETWNALLARRMYRDLEGHKFWAVMLSFSDEDFQKLVFNENEEKRKEEVEKMAAPKAADAPLTGPLLA